MFIRFDTTHERGRQTDTQTDRPHDGIGRAYASRGKNCQNDNAMKFARWQHTTTVAEIFWHHLAYTY